MNIQEQLAEILTDDRAKILAAVVAALAARSTLAVVTQLEGNQFLVLSAGDLENVHEMLLGAVDEIESRLVLLKMPTDGATMQ